MDEDNSEIKVEEMPTEEISAEAEAVPPSSEAPTAAEGETEITRTANSDEEGGEGENDGEGETDLGDESEEDAPTGPVLPLISVVEAVLFAAREPLKPAQIARAVGKGTRQDAVRTAVDELNVHYLESGRAFEIAEISGRFQLMSRPEYVDHIRRIHPKNETEKRTGPAKLTQSALETLSIIAYKQPATRGEIEHIRGVACGPALKTLLERGTVRVVGKKTDTLGQPLMYGTTDAFLIEFGLGSLDELPLRGEFMQTMGNAQPAAESISSDEETGEEDSGQEQA